jgi:chemotaxis protein MotB
MARKSAWEDLADSDLGPYAKPRGTRWGRLFSGLLVVGCATFVAAYYLPLYRAQQRLSDQYRELSQKSSALSDSASKTQVELKSVSAERDQLLAQQDQRDSVQKQQAGQAERARGVLSSKLDKPLKKGSAVLVASGGTLLVAFDDAWLFLPQRLDLAPAASALLCEAVKGSEAKSLTVSAALAPGAPLPVALSKSFATPWALSAARAAAVAEALADKCAFPGAQLSAAGNADHDPFAAQLASSKLAAARVVLALGFH